MKYPPFAFSNPLTSNLYAAPGLAVPIPTLPVEAIRILSTLFTVLVAVLNVIAVTPPEPAVEAI